MKGKVGSILAVKGLNIYRNIVHKFSDINLFHYL